MARAKAIFFGTGVACLLAIACAEGSTLEQELNQNGSGGTDLNPNPGDGTAATGTGGNGNTAGAGNTAGDGNTAGGGNTGGGGNTDTCNPQWANQMGEASCDSCLLSSCCETLAECDYGTPCELLGQCIEVN